MIPLLQREHLPLTLVDLWQDVLEVQANIHPSEDAPHVTREQVPVDLLPLLCDHMPLVGGVPLDSSLAVVRLPLCCTMMTSPGIR